MLFNSFPFILLVIITLVLYYNRFFGAYQVPILIISSFTFYAYSQPYLLFLLFVSASINAIVSYKVYLEKIIKKKKIYATIGVVFNLLVIIFFKYGRKNVKRKNIIKYSDFFGFICSLSIFILDC